MLVSQVPELKTLLELSRFLSVFTEWADNLLTTDKTRTCHDSNCTPKGWIPAGDDVEKDKFDTNIKLQEN